MREYYEFSRENYNQPPAAGGRLVFFFDPASDAIDYADCKQKDAAKNAEYANQPDEHGGRIFIALHDKRDEQDPYSHKEEWHGFVDWFRQSQGLILYADRRSASQHALYRSHVPCPTATPAWFPFMVKH
jgi:hypothetical protein